MIATAIDAVLRGILEEPGDDLARLVYADCLEESGRDAEAAFVRASMAHSLAKDAKVLSREVILALGAFHRLARDEGNVWVRHNPAEMSAETLAAHVGESGRFALWRGLPEVWCVKDVPTFEREAEAVFSRHPIRRVALRCGLLRVLSAWHEETETSIGGPLFALLSGGGPYLMADPRSTPARCYDSPALARADLEACMVRYGRALNRLPPLEVP